MTALLADGDGHDILAEIVHDYLMKAAIVGVLAIVVIVAMVIIWKKVGTKPESDPMIGNRSCPKATEAQRGYH